MSGVNTSSPFAEPVPVAGGENTAESPYTDKVEIPTTGHGDGTAISPFVTEVKDDIADVEHVAEEAAHAAEAEGDVVVHDAEHDAAAAETEGKHVFTEVKDEAEKVVTEIETDVKNAV